MPNYTNRESARAIMTVLNVPFIENPDNHCVPATTGMILAYFLPEKKYTMSELDKLCGYVEGRGTWQAESLLQLHKLDFQVHAIESFDHEAFASDPQKYLSSILDKEALDYQLKHTDLELEAQRIQEYIDLGLPLENRPATDDDIRQFIDNGWLVRLEVNDRPLAGKTGYNGHSILVIGYDDNGAIIHNPDGMNGNKPNQKVSWELLNQAWKEFGGSFSLYAFKK